MDVGVAGGGDLAGVALAAGEARRLRPLSAIVPKPLCPVGNVALVHGALDRLAAVGAEPAVNVHHHADAISAAVAHRAHVSHEIDRALGTAGGVANLAEWIAGRPVLVINADTWTLGSPTALLEGWDGERVRVSVPGGPPFTPASPVTGTVLPWSVVAGLATTPSGLYETVWRDAAAAGQLEVVTDTADHRDCGTVARLLEANLTAIAASGDRSIVDPESTITGVVHTSAIGAGAVVEGRVERCVIGPGTTVARGEVLRDAIRVRGPWGQRTFVVR